MRTARSIGLVVGLTIVVLVATGAMLTVVHYNSAAKQQRLVSSNYKTIALMRQADDKQDARAGDAPDAGDDPAEAVALEPVAANSDQGPSPLVFVLVGLVLVGLAAGGVFLARAGSARHDDVVGDHRDQLT